MDIVSGHYFPVVFGKGFEPTFVQVRVNQDRDVRFEVDNSSKFKVAGYVVFCTHAPYVGT